MIGDRLAYQVDVHGTLASVDAGWEAFALANGAAGLTAALVVGRPLADFVADATTRQLYRDLMARARRDGAPIWISFRCDGPEVRRMLRMTITPLPGGAVRFETVVLAEAHRPRVELLDPASPRSDGTLVSCSWCQRIQLPDGTWHEAEEAIEELGLFHARALPLMSHGVCPTCERNLLDGLEAAGGHRGGRIAELGEPVDRVPPTSV